MNEYISLTITIFFGILSIYFYLKSRKLSKPTILYSNIVYSKPYNASFDLYFDKKTIKNIYGLRLVYFNNGNKEIRSTDIPGNRYPKIVFSESCQLLLAEVKYTTRECNNLNISITDKTAIIEYDYLNAKDGACLEILYENPKEEQTPFKIVSEYIEEIISKEYKHEILYPSSLRFWTYVSLLLSMIVFGFDPNNFESGNTFYLATSIVYIISILMVISMLFILDRKYKLPNYAKFVADKAYV